MGKYDYDAAVLGGGAAGLTSAKLANGLGKKVILIDTKKIGGECTWFGCIPSKSLLQSAKVSYTIKNIKNYGLNISGRYTIKTEAVMKNLRDVVQEVYKGHHPDTLEKEGIKVIEDASYTFIDSHTLKVNGNNISADKIFLTTGSSPLIPTIKGLDKINYHTNDTIFNLNKLPGSMIVIGGGPIGVELASAFNRLDVNVTLIEQFERILINDDKELTEILAEKLAKEGLKIITGGTVSEVSGKKSIKVIYEKSGKTQSLSADLLLIAAGRTPNLQELNLENINVKFDRKSIKTDHYLRTSSDNIYAAGDIVGPYQFSHMSWYQAVTAVSNAFLPIKKKVTYDNVVWCTFTDPELARSGLTEAEAIKKHGKSIKVYRYNYQNLDRSRTDNAKIGLAKIICSKRGMIVGIHILGPRAGELMQEAHLAKVKGIPLHKLSNVLHAYPTYSEIIGKLAKEAYVDRIQNNPIIKLLKLIKGVK